MNEVNDNGRLDQPLVRPPEEAASGEPQGVRPTDVEAKLIGVKGVIVGDHPWAGHTGEIVRIETTPWGRRPVVRLHDQCDHEVFLLSPRDWQPLTGTGHRRTVRPQVGLTF